MKDFNKIRSLVGDSLKEDELQYVDCYVNDNLGLFIPSFGQCGYAARKSHTHPSYMIIIVFSNEELLVERKIELKPKHYFATITSPDIPHNDIDEDFNHYYCTMIDREYFEKQYRLYSENVPCFEQHQFSLCSDILKTLNTFALEYSKGMKNSDITLGAQTTLITHWIIRSILGENLDMRSVSSNYTVGRVQQYIEQHFDENITVKKLAQIAYMSESSLNRLFKKETSFTPIEYLIQTRIAKSKILLKRKDVPITEISQRCGFGSNAHFTSCFKRLVNISPSEYRDAYKE
ncbi:MAG: helix-turn-helix transcriptional regulator [Ruminococcus sp.]|nr:helix-turn-helix transcriptional regulator [Ruminococcus sp.]